MAQYRRWAGGRGGGGGGGGGGQGMGGLPLDTDSNDVLSVSDRNRLNPQDRLKQSLAAVWYHSHPN